MKKIEEYGTPFQREVWEALRWIPQGFVTTYGAIAQYLGRPRAVRAVGTAVGRNPYAPEVPCHRVVRADGKVGNYSGGEGVATKIALLEKEGVEIREGRVVDFAKRLYRFDDQQVTRSEGS
ncbi:MGMT family protein [Nitratifractor salsuginis]|uniref:methylated-DNA--[protein]-cysteine S-methyltransferase n=1 Tax=Nitratifractor salsuginis (strain DSM 16511 / JCM 12458 / E9I37-1) TaxID=749222 RepID=E6X047_NITSE|nr:MGMT family protein [Nitratifractor salsuginis]ADV46770.1 methylated-DNA/protein-cysteinemethyltransferase [Nitratifractor salsuginis DSM 16511]